MRYRGYVDVVTPGPQGFAPEMSYRIDCAEGTKAAALADAQRVAKIEGRMGRKRNDGTKVFPMVERVENVKEDDA